MSPKGKEILFLIIVAVIAVSALVNAFHHATKSGPASQEHWASLAVSRKETLANVIVTSRGHDSTPAPHAPRPKSVSTVATCTATAVPANDGYAGDYDVLVSSSLPDQTVTASDATDTHSYVTNAAGLADVYLWNTSPGEIVSVTVGAAHCTTTAEG